MEQLEFSPTVNSLAEFTEKIIEFGKHNSNVGQKIWYRGHSSSAFRLIPTIYRETLDLLNVRLDKVLRPFDINLIERGIDLSFSRQSIRNLAKKGISNTPMNRYFLKQHYKIKIRLLDWTESALVALYFALNDFNQKDFDAIVYLLLPFKLNNFSIGKLNKGDTVNGNMIFTSIDEISKKENLFNDEGRLSINQLISKYYRLDVDEGERQFPIAIYPPYLDERMAAQQSCFTLFGNMYDGLSTKDAGSNFLSSITIPAARKNGMLEELRILGFSDFSIYPDLDGLGNSINTEYDTIFRNERLKESSALLFSELLGGSQAEEN